MTLERAGRYNIAMKPKKDRAIFFFLILGVLSILGQTVLLREIITLFYGNEIFYSLGLGAWLCFTGLGSLLSPKVKILLRPRFSPWLILSLLLLLFLFLTIFLRFAVAKFVPSGQLPDLSLTLLTILPVLFLFCFPLGAAFPLAVISFSQQKMLAATNKAYFWETLGLAAGGIIFSLILSTTSFPFVFKTNLDSLRWRYPQIITAVNSPYEQIIVTQNDLQKNFFLNGKLAFQTQESLENKYLLELIKPYVSSAQRILVVGSPTLTQTLQQEFSPLTTLFLEIDPLLLQLEKDLFTDKVTLLAADPRRFWQKTDQSWDLIIVSPGNPQTLLSNRYFTQESLLAIKKRLNRQGVLALTIDLPTDYQSEQALSFGRLIYQTFKSVFPPMELLIKEDQLIFLGSPENLILKPGASPYFWHYFNSAQRQTLKEKLSTSQKNLNTDFEPRAFFAQQIFWQTILNFRSARWLSLLEKIIIPLFLLLYFIFLKSQGRWRLGNLMAISSFTLISLETIIIFLFQIKTGYLYREISLLLALFLIGLAAGVRFSKPVNKLAELRKTFLTLSFLIAIFLVAWRKNIIYGPLFLFLANFVAGVFGGKIFKTLNQLYFQENHHPGFIYAFDLFGASLGALVTASLLLPILGIEKLLLGLAGIIFVNSLLLPNTAD